MKINFNTFEINVTVKSVFRERASKVDLIHFLNELGDVYNYAADYNYMNGCNTAGKYYRDRALTLICKIAEIN